MSHFEFRSHRKVASPLVLNTEPPVLHLTAGPCASNFYVACEAQGGQDTHFACVKLQ